MPKVDVAGTLSSCLINFNHQLLHNRNHCVLQKANHDDDHFFYTEYKIGVKETPPKPDPLSGFEPTTNFDINNFWQVHSPVGLNTTDTITSYILRPIYRSCYSVPYHRQTEPSRLGVWPCFDLVVSSPLVSIRRQALSWMQLAAAH